MPGEVHTCRCGVVGAAPAEFYPSDRVTCKACRKAYSKRKYAARTEEEKAAEKLQDRDRVIRRKYGLSAEDFAAKAEAQGWTCGICSTNLRGAGRQLQVDHCHKTGKVRALLCGPCNRALGHMRDDPARLRKAADYVEAWL